MTALVVFAGFLLVVGVRMKMAHMSYRTIIVWLSRRFRRRRPMQWPEHQTYRSAK